MNQSKSVIALDVGEKRIGMAGADGSVRIARPLGTIDVDGQEMSAITRIMAQEKADTVVIGYPRNQSGEPTAQTAFVESFAQQLGRVSDVPVVFQDESLTSVLAEERLRSYEKPYSKADIDAQAAVIILEDYLEK